MTDLEVILIAIIWVAYGYFAAFRTKQCEHLEDNGIGLYVIYVLLSPAVFIIKAFYGAFKSYNNV